MAKALGCEPEVVETVVTLLLLDYPLRISPIGKLMCTVSVFIPNTDAAGRSGRKVQRSTQGHVAQSDLTLLGDTWVESDPVSQEVELRFAAQRAALSSGNAIAYQKRAQIPGVSTRKGGPSSPVVLDLFELSRHIGVDPRVCSDRLEALKKEKGWRVSFRDNGVGFCLKPPPPGTRAPAVPAASAELHKRMQGMRAAELQKINVCYAFLKEMSKAGGGASADGSANANATTATTAFEPHTYIARYLTEDSGCPNSAFQELLRKPRPASSTLRAVPLVALTEAIAEDPVALGSDPLYTARLCHGTLSYLSAVPDHKLWKAFYDHDFDWLARTVQEIAADIRG
eukprot:TRINITY_DN43089_c0_g1_i1.p1 TRINITY_DN43089_c0_g1~~TRINITY_DN43089_c0_g1_i1.p1  ORF type:complete len:381 (+),score=95.77 TRINITY_DN43089_c0_g1_i1:121-1143(+)